MKINEAKIENLDDETVEVKIGDLVGFKADLEQAGELTSIKLIQDGFRFGSASREYYELTIENPNGFEGEYIGGQTSYTLKTSSDFFWVYR